MQRFLLNSDDFMGLALRTLLVFLGRVVLPGV